MRKENPNLRVLKLMHSFCPSYFPLLLLQTFFRQLSPYFNLYLSAEIVNGIVEMKGKEYLLIRILITLIGNFIISMIGGVLNLLFKQKEILLEQKEAAYFHQKTLTLDYADLENPKVRQLRRKIAESAKINLHGRQLLLVCVGQLVSLTVSIGLSLFLGLEMLLLIFKAGFSRYAVLFLLFMAALILFHVWYSFRKEKKMGDLSGKTSQVMIDENRIDDAIDCYHMGKDVRLYRQDKLIMKVKKFALDLHQKAFRMRASGEYVIGIPLTVVSFVLQAFVYLFVCYYAKAGVFGIGGILKYVGFVQAVINGITGWFHTISLIQNNTPFVRDYLAYLAIPRKTRLGTRRLKKETALSTAGYEFEFRNVSFRYPASDSFALKNISMTIRSGERLAVVGENGAGKQPSSNCSAAFIHPRKGRSF